MSIINKILKEDEENPFQPRRIEDRENITLEKAIIRYKELIEFDSQPGILELLAGDNTELDDYTFKCLLAIPEFANSKNLKKQINYLQKNKDIAENVIFSLESILQEYISDRQFAKKYNIEPPKIKYD